MIARDPDLTLTREARLKEVQENQARYIKRLKSDPLSKPLFKKGDWVRVRTHHLSDKEKFFNAGLASKWEGPYRISETCGNEIYEVEQGSRIVKIHFNDLRPVPKEKPQIVVHCEKGGKNIRVPGQADLPKGLRGRHSGKRSKLQGNDLTKLESSLTDSVPDVNPNHELDYDAEGYLQVYTDGACTFNGTNQARAGAGVSFTERHPLNISSPVKGRQSCNAAELRSVLLAARQARKIGTTKLMINTDSKFLIDSFEKWIPIWIENGLMTARGKPVQNKEDFIQIYDILREFQSVRWRHVHSHQRIYGNEGADHLAKMGISGQSNSEKPETCTSYSSEFDEPTDVDSPEGVTPVTISKRYNLRPRRNIKKEK